MKGKARHSEIKENQENLSPAALPYRDSGGKFSKQKGNNKRRKCGTLRKKNNGQSKNIDKHHISFWIF